MKQKYQVIWRWVCIGKVRDFKSTEQSEKNTSQGAIYIKKKKHTKKRTYIQ